MDDPLSCSIAKWAWCMAENCCQSYQLTFGKQQLEYNIPSVKDNIKVDMTSQCQINVNTTLFSCPMSGEEMEHWSIGLVDNTGRENVHGDSELMHYQD